MVKMKFIFPVTILLLLLFQPQQTHQQQVINPLYVTATGPGPCWSGWCGGGFAEPAACPPGYDDVGYGTNCANCGGGYCGGSNVVDAAFRTVNGWGCPSGYPYLALSVRACKPSASTSIVYVTGTGDGPCWSGWCGGGNGPPLICPTGYYQSRVGTECAECYSNGAYACNANQSWVDQAFRSQISWGCPQGYPYLGISVAECARPYQHTFTVQSVNEDTSSTSYTFSVTQLTWSQSTYSSVRARVSFPGVSQCSKTSCQDGGTSVWYNIGCNVDYATLPTSGSIQVELYECGWLWDGDSKLEYFIPLSSFAATTTQTITIQGLTVLVTPPAPPPQCPDPSTTTPDEDALIDEWLSEDYPMIDPPYPPNEMRKKQAEAEEEEEEGVNATTTKTTLTTTRTTPLPSEWDFRSVDGKNYVGPARNQAGCGTCLSFSVAGMIETMLKFSEYDDTIAISVSPAWLHTCVANLPCQQSQILALSADRRLVIESAYNLLTQLLSYETPDRATPEKYLATETCYPYSTLTSNSALDSGSACALSCAVDSGVRTKVNPPIVVLRNTDLMKAFLVNNGPLVASLQITRAFTKWQIKPKASTCIYTEESVPATLGISHAVLVVGYGSQDGRNYWLIRDSRGSAGICDNGFCKIGFGAMGIDSSMTGINLGSWWDGTHEHLVIPIGSCDSGPC